MGCTHKAEDSISLTTTKLELYKREVEIQRLLALGTPRKVILEQVSKEFKCSAKTVERHYYQIVDEMMQLAKSNRDELRINLMARNDYIYKQALSDGKFKTALDANMAQAKLGGLFDVTTEESKPPEVITITEADFSGDLKVVSDESE